jgi:hypothetical protein
MSRRNLIIVASILISVGAAAALVLSQGEEHKEPGEPASLSAQTQTVGGVKVTVTPFRIDSTGALFDVGLLASSGVTVSVDVARDMHLSVGGRDWGKASWTGSSPGAQNVMGQVSFDAGGPATGSAVVLIDGLAHPVTMTWQLPGAGAPSPG